MTPTWQKLLEESPAESGERWVFKIDGAIPENKTLVKTLVPSTPSLSEHPIFTPRRGYSHHSSAMVLFPSSVQLTTESRNLELLGRRLVIGRN